MKPFLTLLAITLLAACAPSTTIESIADDAKEQLARNYLKRLVDGDTAALSEELHPSLRSANVVAQFNQMRAIIPAGTPSVSNLIGYHLFRSSEGLRCNLTYQFGYDSKWLLANAAWVELPEEKRQIIGMTVRPLPEPLQQTHAFTFKRAGPRHYVFSVAGILIPLFCLGTLIVCVRTKLARRKWMWILFILLGLGQISLNWTTGQLGVAPLYIQLFGAGAMTSSIYAPWVISVSLPVGAISFWIFRNRLKRQALLPLPAGPGEGGHSPQ